MFCRLLIFSKSSFSKISFRKTISVSNIMDPDQARQNVGPDLGPNFCNSIGPDLDPNCLQMLSADDSSKQRINVDVISEGVNQNGDV